MRLRSYHCLRHRRPRLDDTLTTTKTTTTTTATTTTTIVLASMLVPRRDHEPASPFQFQCASTDAARVPMLRIFSAGQIYIYIGIHVRAKENKRTEKKKKNKQQYAYDLHRSRSAIVRFPRSLVPDTGIIIDDSSKMEFTRSNDNSRNSSSSNHWSYHDRSLFTFFTDTIIYVHYLHGFTLSSTSNVAAIPHGRSITSHAHDKWLRSVENFVPSSKFIEIWER